MTNRVDPGVQRTVMYLSQPTRWSWWPFLPVIRSSDPQVEHGFVFDTFHCLGMTGFSATVFKGNIHTLPHGLRELLDLPKEVFNTAEELADAGWRVD